MQGELEQRDGQWQLRFTRRFSHPPEKVWRALTEPAHLAAWFPTTIEGKRAAGAALRFAFPNSEGPIIEGEMLAYDPPSLLEFRWGTGETMRFEVQPDGDGSVLTLLNTFDELGKAARDAAGWHVCLDCLSDHLNGEAASMESREQWKRIHPSYVERFGPEAATIGPPASSIER